MAEMPFKKSSELVLDPMSLQSESQSQSYIASLSEPQSDIQNPIISGIVCPCSQICAITFTYVLILLLNCYMPDHRYTDNGEYIDVLNVISRLLYILNPSHETHVIIDGDMNVDFSRHTYFI